MNESLMRDCLEKEGVSFSQEQMDKLARYDGLLEKYNPALKMVKASGDDFVIRHYADCLVAVPEFLKLVATFSDPTIADLGSGAGLPGIPLAIAMGDVRFALIERMEKRADFLRTAIDVLQLDHVRVVESRLQEVEEKYEIVTCRAFHPFYDVEDAVSSILSEQGVVVLYKGRTETINEEFAKVGNRWRFTGVHVQVPGLDAERALCIGRRKE